MGSVLHVWVLKRFSIRLVKFKKEKWCFHESVCWVGWVGKQTRATRQTDHRTAVLHVEVVDVTSDARLYFLLFWIHHYDTRYKSLAAAESNLVQSEGLCSSRVGSGQELCWASIDGSDKKKSVLGCFFFLSQCASHTHSSGRSYELRC